MKKNENLNGNSTQPIKYWAVRTTRNTIKCFTTHSGMIEASRNIQWKEKGDAKSVICNCVKPDRTLRQLIVNSDDASRAASVLEKHPHLKHTLVKTTANSWDIPTYEQDVDWEAYEKLVFEVAKTLLEAGIESVSFYPEYI